MEIENFSTNINYHLFYGKEMNYWKDEEDNVPMAANIVAVLESVKKEFEIYSLCIDFNKKISIFPCVVNPVSFPHEGFIFLSARGRRWDQYSYQFAYELYHVVLLNGFHSKLKWFEETLRTCIIFLS